MLTRARIVLLAALLTSAMAPAARATAFLVPIGHTRIALDAPAGFADTGFLGSPRINELAQALTPASNRILLFAISDADLRAFMHGDQPNLRRYMLVVTPRSMFWRRLSLDEFSSFARNAIQALGPLALGSDYAKLLDHRTPGRPHVLADLRSDPEVVSVLLGTRLPPQTNTSTGTRYILSTTTLMLLRGKLLSLSVYTGYNGSADLSWVKYVTQNWIRKLQRINLR